VGPRCNESGASEADGHEEAGADREVLVPGVDFVRNQMIFVFDLWKERQRKPARRSSGPRAKTVSRKSDSCT
jgi:hypothetical protein